jgi:hypothetical protein
VREKVRHLAPGIKARAARFRSVKPRKRTIDGAFGVDSADDLDRHHGAHEHSVANVHVVGYAHFAFFSASTTP